ncbi:MAG TPA: hypothetical protein VFO10_20280 [Oligoflexus sp.]|uniref:hypothetical protein n=1 Tax=Oligoflexus sp. TaxID=1971216 RepID=UPI002D804148|nr:hypothetical protein [Oligoflexus sp.]HET9239609.1 hypothetical protein [Oligoflexus sp.]
MADEQPKSESKKVINPVEGSSAVKPELTLDFSRPPMPANKIISDHDPLEAGEFSSEEPLQALQQVSNIKYRSIEHPNHMLRIVLGFGLLILVFGGLFLGLPYYLMRTDRAINKATKDSIRFVQKNLEKRGLGAQTKPYAESLLAHLKLTDAPGTDAAAAKAWRDMDCRFLIQEALSRRFRGALDPTGQYLLTNCQLAQDMPQAALRQLTENYGDAAQFQRNGDSWEMLPMQLLAGEAQRRMQVFRLVAPKTYPGCRRWAASPSCMQRFVDQARQPLRSRFDDGYAVLKPGLKNQNPVLKAWLALATSWNFAKTGNGVQVEGVLKEAAGLFPRLYDPFLEREIFRQRMLNAYKLRDKKLAMSIWKARPAVLMESDEAGFYDINLLRALMGKGDKAGPALDEFFAHPESHQRYRFDPYFIRIVVEQAIRYQKPLDGLTYIDRIHEQQEDDKILDSEWLPLLRARLLLAQQNGLEALQTLQPLERFVVRSPELAHLKGTAMLHAYSTKPYRLLAAAEFQKAANLEPRGEHFFALILSFLDSKDFQKAEAAFKFWQRVKPRPGEDAWRSLAHGLLNYSQGREAVAAQIWNELSQRNPGFVAVKSLKTNLAEDPNYLKDQIVKKIIPMLPADGPMSPLAVFQ